MRRGMHLGTRDGPRQILPLIIENVHWRKKALEEVKKKTKLRELSTGGQEYIC